MIRSIPFIVVSTLVLGLVLPAAGMAQNQVLLGERHVTDHSEKDTIKVGKEEGAFKRIQVKATGGAIEFKRIVIHFENGDEQVLEKNRVLSKGKKSGRIDLEGGSRHIDKVVFYYEARTRGWKGANVKLWGIR